MKRDDYFKVWSDLHGGAVINGVVKLWLTISYAIVKPLAKVKVTPNTLTLLGLVTSICFWIESPKSWAVLFLLCSLIFDGLDGSLAIILNRTSKQGAVIDSVVDRMAEAFWFLASVKLGAPAWLILIIGLCAYTQEYLRARAAGLGMREIGIVTIAERPVRASFIFIGFLEFNIFNSATNIVYFIWLLFSLIALLQLLKKQFQR